MGITRALLNDQFRKDIMFKKLSLTNLQKDEIDRFIYLTSKTLRSYFPLKEKHVRHNQAPFVSNNFLR